ncbi:MAG: serine/threonine protein kinase [Aliiglaciecola sp.]
MSNIITTTFDFAHLGPDLILDAIESKGLVVESGLLALNSYENRVYQFLCDDKKRYVAKFYRPQRWQKSQIQEEHDFALELQEHEIPVVAPLKLGGETLHDFNGFNFALFLSVGGREFEVDNLDQLEWMGRFIGRIHRVSSQKSFSHRPTLGVQEHLIDASQTLRKTELIPQSLHTSFFAILDLVVEACMQRYESNNVIRLHGDCHPGNILWRDGPTFVDLDDCRMGPAIQDLWMMLSGDRHQQRIQLDTLVEAYEEFSDFDSTQLQLIEPLRGMRMVHYMAWLSKRWQDPAFPLAFPWFADNKYWEGQILALKEQLSALNEPSLTLF